MKIILLLLIVCTYTQYKPQCLLNDPLTDSCIQSITFQMVDRDVLPYLCVIAYERNLLKKAEEFCRQGSIISSEAGYKYFQTLIAGKRFKQAFIMEYSLFFTQPFRHNSIINETLTALSADISSQANKIDLKEISYDQFSQAIVYFYNNETKKSYKCLKEYMETKNKGQLVYQHFLMARIFEKEYQYYDGMNYISKVIDESDTTHPYLYHLKGNFLMHHVQFEKAIQEFEYANIQFHNLYKSNGFSFSNYNIGICYEKLNRVQDALKYYQKSVINLNSAQSLNALGHAHFSLFQKNKKQDHIQKAQLYYKKSLQENENYLIALYNLGVLHLETGNYNQSLKQFKQCIQKDTLFKSCKYGLLKTYYFNRDARGVISVIESIQKDQETIAQLAAILYEFGDHEQAIKLFSIDKEYKSALLYEWRGFNEYELKKYVEAEKSFARAVFLGSKTGYIYHSLGMSQYEQKKYEECTRSFSHAYKLDARKETKIKLEQCRNKSGNNDL